MSKKKPAKLIRATEEELMEGDGGACLACGAKTSGVEPDARNYPCDECGESEVYGLEELVVMNCIEIADSEDDE